jgi:hypothetical protein
MIGEWFTEREMIEVVFMCRATTGGKWFVDEEKIENVKCPSIRTR